ncbi:MAG TPA: IS21 family transposase [Pirellulales bacterium]|nr:IS21 family transposase [Pirellulales bacterium]
MVVTMANHLKMADVQCILTLHSRGWSGRRIARELGVNRETVGRYLRLSAADKNATAVQNQPEAPAGNLEPAEANPANAPAGIWADRASPSATDVAAATGPPKVQNQPNAPPGSTSSRQAGSTGLVPTSRDSTTDLATGDSAPSRASGPSNRCEPWRELIVQKLDAGLTAQRIYQDLTSDHQYIGSYYSVLRLVRKLSGKRELPCRRMEVEPGQEAQVDFGRGAPIRCAEGKRRTSWVFRIVLSHSRKAYSEAVSRQSTNDFLRCLENAFAHFGGLPRTLVIDNLRAAVKRADWFDPELCPKVASFARHYGIVILPTKPYTPRHKGKVESGVKYVKSNALRGRTFASLAAQNQHLLDWETQVADRRIHGTTRKQVAAVFEESERPALLPLPPARFELFQEGKRCVHRDGHIEVKHAYYSVPPEFLGQELWVRWDGRVVRIFDQKMRQIALHAQREPGQFSTQSNHIAAEKISSVERGAAWLIQRAGRIGAEAQSWAQAVIQNRGVEGTRVLVGLNSLHERYESRQIERACQIAHGHGAFHLRTIRELLKRHEPHHEQAAFAFVAEHPIIRPLSDYSQLVHDAFADNFQQACLEHGPKERSL